MIKRLILYTMVMLTATTLLADNIVRTSTHTSTSTKNGVKTTTKTVKQYTADGKVYVTTTQTTESAKGTSTKTTTTTENSNEVSNTGSAKDDNTSEDTPKDNESEKLDAKWTNNEVNAANTAQNIGYLTQEEKNVIMYINLARMYPKKFAQVEVSKEPKQNSAYVKSLIKTLNSMSAVPAYTFSDQMYKTARCFAEESGNSGYIGHKRTKCPDNYSAECCSYGHSTGRDIALQLLIDEGTTNLGHRVNCLNKAYRSAGACIHSHKQYDYCCVVDIAR